MINIALANEKNDNLCKQYFLSLASAFDNINSNDFRYISTVIHKLGAKSNLLEGQDFSVVVSLVQKLTAIIQKANTNTLSNKNDSKSQGLANALWALGKLVEHKVFTNEQFPKYLCFGNNACQDPSIKTTPSLRGSPMRCGL